MVATKLSRRLMLGCLLAALTPLATGCSPATQVVGTWDRDSSKPLPAEFQAFNQDIAARLLLTNSTFQLQFAGDGNFSLKFSAGPLKTEKTGSWRFVKADGKTLILMIKEQGKNEESELRFTVVDNEHAVIAIPLPFAKDPVSFPFVKAKPAS